MISVRVCWFSVDINVEFLFFRVIIVSRNASFPLFSYLRVNCMYGSIKFRVSRNVLTAAFLMIAYDKTQPKLVHKLAISISLVSTEDHNLLVESSQNRTHFFGQRTTPFNNMVLPNRASSKFYFGCSVQFCTNPLLKGNRFRAKPQLKRTIGFSFPILMTCQLSETQVR